VRRAIITDLAGLETLAGGGEAGTIIIC